MSRADPSLSTNNIVILNEDSTIVTDFGVADRDSFINIIVTNRFVQL